MKPKPDPEMIDDENPEWTDDNFARAVPFSRLPPLLRETLASVPHVVIAEPPGSGLKFVPLPIREDIVAMFQATGEGWEQRINDVLHEWIAANFPFDRN
jgi:uncharacterized protein (DUF4415 family)